MENHAVDGKSSSIEKTASYQENAHHAPRGQNAIVEKLTADGSSVVRKSLLVANGRRCPGQNRERQRPGSLADGCRSPHAVRAKGSTRSWDQLPHHFVSVRVISWLQFFSLNHETTLKSTKPHEGLRPAERAA
jgi:hypothetical protein